MFRKKEKKVKEKGESRVKGNSFGAAGFVLGIMSAISFGFTGILFSIVGFMFCFIQQKNKPTKLGKAGLIISIIGFILNVAYLLWLLVFGGLEFLQNLNSTFPAS
jgi:apolipoprotein N-acyltransferase